PVADLVAVADTATTAEDTPVNGDVSGNDSTSSGGALSFAKASDPAHGSVVVNGDGTYTYTPDANWSGADSFDYTVTDAASGESLTRTVTVTVTPAVDLTAVADSISTSEDTAVSGTVASNDSTSSGGALSFAKASDPAHGSVVVNGDGTYTYTPDANWSGADSFDYTVTDAASGESLTRTVTVTVTPTNDAPVATDAAATTPEDTPVSGQLVASDVDGDALTFAKAGDPANGSVMVNTDGSWTYVPNADFHGNDSFTVTVSDGQGGSKTVTVAITVTPVNDAPVALDDNLATSEDTSVTYTAAQLLGNDSDVDGDSLVIASVTSGAGGSAVLNADGTVTFTPNANFNGVADFTYTVSDGTLTSNTATVRVSVTPTNDAPVAVDAAATTPEDTPVSGQLTATDVDGDALTFVKASDPANGSVTVNADGSWTYVPNANFHGNDSFTVTVSDGQGGSKTVTVAITVTPVNDAPVALDDNLATSEDTSVTYTAAQLLGNDSDVDGDSLVIASVTSGAGGSAVLNADGTVTFTPNANFNGIADFTYTVSDGTLTSNTATVRVSVTPTNDAPVAVDAAATTPEDIPVSGQLTATDLDGDALTFAKAGDPANGSVTVNTDGSWTYTPNANFHGSDSFTVTVSDGQGGSKTVTVAVTVTPMNDAPVAVDAAATTPEDTPVSGQLTATDLDGDALTFAKAGDPANGSVTVNTDGSWTYVPNANFHGSDSFTVTVSDGQGGSKTVTVAVTVTPTNDAPVAVDAAATTPEDTPVSGQLVASDVDGDALTFAKAGDPANGSVTVNTDGSWTYVPNANFHGSDSFTVTVSDGQGGSKTVTVAVTVTPANDAPVAVDAATTTPEDTPVTGQLVASDLDGDALSFVKAGDPANGSVTVNTDGSWTYTPNANFHGNDSFTVTVSDGQGGSKTVTVAVTVTPGNDAPVAVGDAVTVTEDVPFSSSIQLDANDSDLDGDSLSVVAGTFATAQGGSIVIAADGSYTYTPPANFNGTDSVAYTVTDGKLTDVGTLTITVSPVNDPALIGPFTDADGDGKADAQQGSVREDTVLTSSGKLTVSDVDAGEAKFVVQTATAGSHGTFSIDASGNWSYVLDNDAAHVQRLTSSESVVERFTVQTLDGATTVVEVKVRGLDDVPAVTTKTPTPSADGSTNPSGYGGTSDSPSLSVLPFDSMLGIDGSSPSSIWTRLSDLNLDQLQRGRLSDIYTSSGGFRVVVMDALEPSLTTYRGMPDQYVEIGTMHRFATPYDAFVHTDPTALVILAAKQANGENLPSWIWFNPQTGKFEVLAPAKSHGDVTVKLLARDSQGREASTLFRISIGEKSHATTGRAGLSEQLRMAAKRPEYALGKQPTDKAAQKH
ncbi:Ig-like domain-containing protein, partial [Pseudomonas sp. GCM10022188]|uniref:Ig-like domain-containing protein n=1 Tax=Pseudomonas TaxID=286 RepID=UPI001E468283